MSDITSELYLPGVLVALIGPIAFGVGYILKSKMQSNQNRKLALYLLLEIWHKLIFFQKYNSDEFLEIYLKQLLKSLPDTNHDELNLDLLKEHFSPLIFDHSMAMALGDLEEFESKYQVAIELLASNDPVLAYRISSTSNIKSAIHSMNEILQSLSSKNPDQAIPENTSQGFVQIILALINTASIDQLEKNLLELSGKISPSTYFSCKRSISLKETMLSDLENSEFFEEMTKQTLTSIFENQSST